MSITRWADTSALLHQNGLLDPQADIAISTITLKELENIKSHSNENNTIKYKAREAVRSILTSNKFNIILSDNYKIDKMIKKYHFLNDIPDHRILCAAELQAIEQGKTILFLTSDALQYLFALQMPHLEAIYPLGDELLEKRDDEWSGWGKY